MGAHAPHTEYVQILDGVGHSCYLHRVQIRHLRSASAGRAQGGACRGVCMLRGWSSRHGILSVCLACFVTAVVSVVATPPKGAQVTTAATAAAVRDADREHDARAQLGGACFQMCAVEVSDHRIHTHTANRPHIHIQGSSPLLATHMV